MTNRIAHRSLVYVVVVVSAVVILSVVGKGFVGLQTKPIREEPINTYFLAPPNNIADMVLGADAVVRGRLVSMAPATARLETDGGPPMTSNRVQVLEVLHNFTKHQVAPDSLEILRPSGDFDRGTHIERAFQVGFPEFQRGREYLFFLTWNEVLGGWVPTYGPDSVFELASDRPIPFGSSTMARSLGKKTSADLLREVQFLGR
jgi:hypothetical protein